MRYSMAVIVMFVGLGSVGCDPSPGESGSVTNSRTAETKPKDDPTPKDHDGHDHAATKVDHDQAGGTAPSVEVVQLGTTRIGAWTVRATRDQGDLKPGGDAPIDVWITAVAEPPAKVAAVRFWIGTENAKGSVKAKADIEDPKEPNRWHTHAEIPNPLPPGCRLWVEIEEVGGPKHVGSYDLKR